MSRSFELRCSACKANFEYDNDLDWSKHIENSHKENSSGRTVTVSKQNRCVFCPKSICSNKHVLNDHADLVFRCRQCSVDDETNWFKDFPDVRRHCMSEHGARDVASHLQDYVRVPTNLLCPVCKYCSQQMHGQTMADLEEHFKVEHPALDKITRHMDFYCRFCMQADEHDTFDDLEIHVNKSHPEFVHPHAGGSNGDSLDVSSDIVQPLIEAILNQMFASCA